MTVSSYIDLAREEREVLVRGEMRDEGPHLCPALLSLSAFLTKPESRDMWDQEN